MILKNIIHIAYDIATLFQVTQAKDTYAYSIFICAITCLHLETELNTIGLSQCQPKTIKEEMTWPC